MEVAELGEGSIHRTPMRIVLATVALAAAPLGAAAMAFILPELHWRVLLVGLCTAALSVMFAVGRCLPHSNDRAPRISLVTPDGIKRLIGDEAGLGDWRVGRGARVNSGFYASEALELVRR